MICHILLQLMYTIVGDVVGKIDKELGQTAFRSSVVSENRRECRIAKRFRKALPKSLTSSCVIAQTEFYVRTALSQITKAVRTEGSNGRRASIV
jgi:hypothetical protein